MSNKFLIVCGGAGAKLLGQRRVLGISGELHIDVSSEVREYPDDPRSLVLKLDEPVAGTTGLFNGLGTRIGKPPKPGHSSYVQTAITEPPDVAHARLLMDIWPAASPLRDGLAQAPAIGGATIRHQSNVAKLREVLHYFVTSLATNVGPQNPLDVWIVSSTAGGTGEGIHRFVGAMMADVVGKTFQTALLKLNFIRIGPLTYRRVNAQRTMVNTFFGIAADAAFELKLKEDFPGAAINWFYLDLPDVGIDSRGQVMRAELIDMAAKAIMLDDLAQGLNQLLINNQGSRMVVVRIGYWGKDFGDNQKYYQTLEELACKLKGLIEPDYRSVYIEGKLHPEFKGTEDLTQVVKRIGNPSELLMKGWRFPKLSGGKLTTERFQELVAEWKKEVNKLIAPREIGTFGVQFFSIETVTVESQQHGEELPLLIPVFPSEDTFDATWLRGIYDTHRVKAWCAVMLDGPDGLKAQLLTQAKICSDAQHRWRLVVPTKDRARNLTRHLGKFVNLLEQVNYLMELETEVARALEVHLASLKDLMKLVIDQQDVTKATVSGMAISPIRVAELDAPLDRPTGESWLRLLIRAAQQNRSALFREEVLRGGTSLTQVGLINVLDLPETADAPMIKRVLAERMGRMLDPDSNEYDAPWWQSKSPPWITKEYPGCFITPSLIGSHLNNSAS